MKSILVFLILSLSMQASAQKTFTVTNDKQLHQPIYNGKVTFDDLNKEKSFDWLRTGESGYKPEGQFIKVLQGELKGYEIIVFLGTWCGDTHNLLPKFEKVLQQANYPMSKLTMYAVDMEKKTTNGEQKKYGITNVPTFIFFKDGKEAGRITESVKKSIEEDLVNIIRNAHT